LMIVYTSYSFFDENLSVLSLPLSRSLSLLLFSLFVPCDVIADLCG
jgi:hypothetical protein